MPLAEWSGEGAVEDQQHIVLAKEVGQAEELAFVIREGEIWSWGVDAYLGHNFLLLKIVQHNDNKKKAF